MSTQMVKGKFRFRSYCKKCDNKRRHRVDTPKSRASKKKGWAMQRERQKQLIEVGSMLHIAKRILKDCRQNDKTRSMICGLDLLFVQTEIQKACFYCGEAEYRRSLDRIDNSLGHLKSNVVTACVRCNLTRTTMPYEAWLIVAKGMREAREKGLFGDWVGIKRCGRRDMVAVEGVEPITSSRTPDLESSASAVSPHRHIHIDIITWVGTDGGI